MTVCVGKAGKVHATEMLPLVHGAGRWGWAVQNVPGRQAPRGMWQTVSTCACCSYFCLSKCTECDCSANLFGQPGAGINAASCCRPEDALLSGGQAAASLM